MTDQEVNEISYAVTVALCQGDAILVILRCLRRS
jgi:hypothetical protein